MTANPDNPTTPMNESKLLQLLFALVGGLIVIGTELAFNSPGATVTMMFAVIIGWLVWWLGL